MFFLHSLFSRVRFNPTCIKAGEKYSTFVCHETHIILWMVYYINDPKRVKGFLVLFLEKKKPNINLSYYFHQEGLLCSLMSL